MNINQVKKKITKLIMFTMSALMIICGSVLNVRADEETDYQALAEERKSLPIQTDSIENWPAGPHLGCEAAMLMEVRTGTVLYEKNINEHLYPASVTKMLTALIAREECDMDEKVTFSSEAINSIDWRTDANLGIAPGNTITMEQCLYGLLVGSANEVAYAIAEHISGDGNIAGFAEKMNKRAEELGCTDSHFVTPNGIHDDNHYTSAHDLALIAKAFYSDELLSKMASTTSYKVPVSPTQPRDDMIVYAKSKLHPGKEYAYDGLVGTKTGYTEYARQTLVSCAEKDGLRLICVVLKEESPAQYTDTIDLFNYGFDNFKAVNISDNDKTYVIQSLNFFSTESDFFGSSKPILQMNSDDYVVLPVDADFESTTSELSYSFLSRNEIAKVNYYFNDVFVGSAKIEPAVDKMPSFDFGPREVNKVKEVEEEDIVVINVKNVIITIISVAFVLTLIVVIVSLIRQKGHGYHRRRRTKKSYRTINTRDLDWKRFK